VVSGSETPTPMAHYSQGVLVGDTLYAAGQIASDYRTGVPPEARQDPAFPYYGSNIQKQTRYVLKNLKSVFHAAGCEFKDVVKAQVFLIELDDFHYFDQVWKEFFPTAPPRTTVQIGKLLVPGCRVEIDWVDSETLTAAEARAHLEDADGVLIPGGFGVRGIEGKIEASRVAREGQIVGKTLPRSGFGTMFVSTWHKTHHRHHHFLRRKS